MPIQENVGLRKQASNGYSIPIRGERILSRTEGQRLRTRGSLSKLEMSEDRTPSSMLGFLDTLITPSQFVSSVERERLPGMNIFQRDAFSPEDSGQSRHGFESAPPAVLGGMSGIEPRRRNLIDESYSNLLD